MPVKIEKFKSEENSFFWLLIGGIFFNFSFAFWDIGSVLPVFVSKFTSSKLIIGLVSSVQRAGWYLPQLLIANYIADRPYKKPLYMKLIFAGRLAWIPIALSVLIWGNENPALTLSIFFTGFAIFTFTDGCSGVPWLDMVGKMVPPLKRGFFHGMIQFAGGVLALIGGFIIKSILGKVPFPQNYSLIFFLAAITLLASASFQIPLRESRAKRVGKKYPLKELLKRIPVLLKNDKVFVRYIIVQLLMGCYMLAFPFYAVFANKELGFGEEIVGYFVVAQMVGGIIASLIWAYISDKKSNLLLIRIVGSFFILIPCLVLITPFLPLPKNLIKPFFLLVYVLLGSNMRGMWIGFTNYLMEIIEQEKRPVYFGLMNTFNFPLVFVPFLGGYIINALSFSWLFLITAFLMVVSFLLTWLLPEPRRSRETNMMVQKGVALNMTKK